MRMIRVLLLLLAVVFLSSSFYVSRQVFSYFQPVSADGTFVLLRLEDVGPGGSYGTLEGLGKLRAVLEYLQQENVPYHVTVVSRWISISEQGEWVEAGIDTPTPLTESFVQLLRRVQSNGAILGMHGYTHQYGHVPRADNHHKSGFANEFNVPGEPFSETPEYAQERIEKSLQAFKQNGLKPAFWESPHYNSSVFQQQVFRSYMGIIYEPHKRHLRSLRDIVYVEEENEWKAASSGAVYIPAPLRYIDTPELVDQILTKLNGYDGLASLYYHPYLEFPYLEPVVNDGQAVSEDGLPVFRYKSDTKSPLHKLVEGVRSLKHYRFGTIHDVVPFSPAHRIHMSPNTGKKDLLSGDVNGDCLDDWISVDQNSQTVSVTLSNLDWPRNHKTLAPEIWLQHGFLKNTGTTLAIDVDQDKRADILQIGIDGVQIFRSEGDRFQSNPQTVIFPDAVRDMLSGKHPNSVFWRVGKQKSGKPVLLLWDQENHKGLTFELEKNHLIEKATFPIPPIPPDEQNQVFLGDVTGDGLTDIIIHNDTSNQTWVMQGENDSYGKAEVWYETQHGNLVAIADFNGDGLSDLLFHDQAKALWQTVHSTGSQFAKMPASFGPWGRVEAGIPMVGDWDGNGKADIGMYHPFKGILDVSLSFQD
ncbi:VCBS repeat protein [Effusibacillus lacus]|nr:VCBS repeat protein [Effusibacillus lacus]